VTGLRGFVQRGDTVGVRDVHRMSGVEQKRNDVGGGLLVPDRIVERRARCPGSDSPGAGLQEQAYFLDVAIRRRQ
jgi:hypothetical protein